jgi:succinate dehydrogenase (ubiquinone) membrane anchor subunit
MAAGAVKHGASGVLDASLALTLVLHSHIGFTASLMDYLHKRKYPIAGPISSWTLRAASVATLAGLYGESARCKMEDGNSSLTWDSSFPLRIPNK